MTLVTNEAVAAGEISRPLTRRAPPNIDPETLLSRRELSQALKELGTPFAEASLATMATRGSGPPFQKYGRRVTYKWGPSRDWALGRMSKPVNSTSELDRPAKDASPNESLRGPPL